MKKHLLNVIIIGIVCISLLTTIQPVSAYSNELQNKNANTQTNQETEDYGIIGLNWYNKPATYAQLISWYQALEALYPSYIEVFKANELYGTGMATGGYDLYYVRI
ncbi:MAG: hypothetical protein NTZ75_04490, partial [Euryarchaeota archaeon]|nr:hypothetical protein [Euryarchaeota archaeon]